MLFACRERDGTRLSWGERDFLSVEVGKVGKSQGRRERWESQKYLNAIYLEFGGRNQWEASVMGRWNQKSLNILRLAKKGQWGSKCC